MTKSTASAGGKTHAGLDVSLKETAVCIVDDAGRILCERMLPTDPRVIANHLGERRPSSVSAWRAAPRRPGRWRDGTLFEWSTNEPAVA